ncbi:MAG: NUDIX domain-containing protein [Candidatus Neomarinimicrobiota bacterium]|nr:NUDIX domain-containing protein [Candidatus Neomarinimicrobiota bacterium]|tara:strand:- start:442 stop:903 length:462 start_codon:yes stop_codon:yes gene_type:complete
MPNMSIRVIDAYVYRTTKNGILFLILKRAKTKMYEHIWQGVAGKIEKGEKSWETAKRELLEETGLEPIKMFIADHVSKFYEQKDDRINLVPVFGIEVNKEEVVLSDEHSDYKWVTINEALDLLVWMGQKKAIKIVHDMISSNDDRMRWSTIEL